MESRVSFNFFFSVKPESWFSDGRGIPAGWHPCLWCWAPFHSACRCRTFFVLVFFKTVHLVLSWLWSGVHWQPCPSASLFLFMFVIDTQAFAIEGSILHRCLCFGRPGLALGTGDALDPFTSSIRAVLELSELCGKWWAAITPNLYHHFKRIITIVKKHYQWHCCSIWSPNCIFHLLLI